MMFVQLRFTLQFLRKQEVGWQCLSVSVDAADHGHVLACRWLFCTRYPPFSAYHAIAKSYRACIWRSFWRRPCRRYTTSHSCWRSCIIHGEYHALFMLKIMYYSCWRWDTTDTCWISRLIHVEDKIADTCWISRLIHVEDEIQRILVETG